MKAGFTKMLKLIFFYIPLVLGSVLIISNLAVKRVAKKSIYNEVSSIPKKKVGLLLGTIKILPNGRKNWYFIYRIRAAAELYHEGKIDHFIVSGDNNRRGYNEPEDMKKALIAKGIPSNKIHLDYAGFRTLDSVIRAKEIFEQDDFTIISQRFHNERALYIANYYNIKAQAFNAKGIHPRWGYKVLLRESLARVKALLDIYILKTEPKFLGPKNPIT